MTSRREFYQAPRRNLRPRGFSPEADSLQKCCANLLTTGDDIGYSEGYCELPCSIPRSLAPSITLRQQRLRSVTASLSARCHSHPCHSHPCHLQPSMLVVVALARAHREVVNSRRRWIGAGLPNWLKRRNMLETRSLGVPCRPSQHRAVYQRAEDELVANVSHQALHARVTLVSPISWARARRPLKTRSFGRIRRANHRRSE
jgi:hypothetical protein